MHSFISSSAVLASTLFSAVHAFGIGQQHAGGQSLAVYWGQGANQNSLGSFCDDSTIDIIPIGFVNVFPDQQGTYGYPGTNFGNACGGYYVDSKNETTQFLASCPQIASDITYCQSQGKKILLSLGGASTGVFLASDDSAVAFGDFLHGAFGPPSKSWTGPRPFGDACVDGFDFDIEASASAIPVPLGAYYATMVNHLRTLGKMMITASPQCIVPDANIGDALTNSFFDAIFVQFYNTPQCSARAFFDDTYGAYGGPATNISYDAWISWMQSNSQNPDALVYLGLPAAPGATYGEMYLNTTEAQEILTYFQGKYPAQFGGAMLWEATFSENNQVNGESYAANIKSFLTGSSGAPTTTPAVPTTTPTNSATNTWNATGPGFPYGGPTVSPTTTTSPSGSASTWTAVGTGNTYTGRPTGTTSPVGPVTTTDAAGNAYTYTPAHGSTTGSPDTVVTTTDRRGNTYTYTSTNIQPTGTSYSSSVSSAWSEWDPTTTSSVTSSSSTESWTAWDPSTTASAAPTSTSSSNWAAWDPSTTASAVSTSTSSVHWAVWDPSTTASPVSTSTSSVHWAVWDPSTTASPVTTSTTSWAAWDPSTTASPVSTSTNTEWPAWNPTTTSPSWEATITATDAKTLTIMPLPASSTYAPSVASWSSYWTQRGSWSSSASAGGFFTESSSASPVATSTSRLAWSFTGWASMPSYTTVAPLPSIATVTAAAAAPATTTAGAVGGASATTTASAGPSVSVYVQPAPFLGAASVSRPIFGVLAAVFIGAVAVVL